ncbi:helix-turn-helix domain-containing protein [Clostridium tertium]
MSQEQLAEMLDVSRQAVSKWESGNGYPETEKLILISKALNVSIDYLLLDEVNLEDNIKDEDKNKVIISSGKISIRTFDGTNIVTCNKVTTSKVSSAKENDPKFILYGVDKVTFWGEHKTVLGWYLDKEDIIKEIEEISEAISLGMPTYELKYAANVEIKLFSVKIVEK